MDVMLFLANAVIPSGDLGTAGLGFNVTAPRGIATGNFGSDWRFEAFAAAMEKLYGGING